MVPIPSASKRDDGLAERDWRSVTSWTPESSDEVECSFRSSNFAGSNFATKRRSDQHRHE
jgi:hypothetical protein